MFETAASSARSLWDSMAALSVAVTATAPPAVTVPAVVKVSEASAVVLTLLEASRPPPATPSVCQAVIRTPLRAASAAPSLPAVAVSVAACVAETVSAPVAVTVVSRITARAAEGVASPLNAVEVSGSPRIASTVLKSRFDGFQPIVLNTATKPKVLSKASILVFASASIVAVVLALTVIAAPASEPSVTLAAESATTTLVTISPPKPPQVETSLSSVALIEAASVALTVTSPPAFSATWASEALTADLT